MSKTLYNEDSRYSQKALDIDNATRQALKSLFASYIDEGFSPREISHIMQATIMDFELDAVLNVIIK